MNIKPLYNQAIEHRAEHGCGAYPYQEGKRLLEIIRRYNPKEILEIGTGVGYTAAIMALILSATHICTIEKDPEHVRIAREFFKANNVEKQITIVNESAEQYLPTINRQYDLIFFDGYQIHYEFLPQYERLLKPGGVLVLANNDLQSRTSDQFFAELYDAGKWKVLNHFADTTALLFVGANFKKL